MLHFLLRVNMAQNLGNRGNDETSFVGNEGRVAQELVTILDFGLLFDESLLDTYVHFLDVFLVSEHVLSTRLVSLLKGRQDINLDVVLLLDGFKFVLSVHQSLLQVSAPFNLLDALPHAWLVVPFIALVSWDVRRQIFKLLLLWRVEQDAHSCLQLQKVVKFVLDPLLLLLATE